METLFGMVIAIELVYGEVQISVKWVGSDQPRARPKNNTPTITGQAP